jgi:hypothetical protein
MAGKGFNGGNSVMIFRIFANISAIISNLHILFFSIQIVRSNVFKFKILFFHSYYCYNHVVLNDLYPRKILILNT